MHCFMFIAFIWQHIVDACWHWVMLNVPWSDVYDNLNSRGADVSKEEQTVFLGNGQFIFDNFFLKPITTKINVDWL